MPLQLYYRPSFQRSLKNIGHEERKIVSTILQALTIYYQHGCSLLEAQRFSQRFFYKQLRKPYYEAGIERNIRVVLKKEGNHCIAILAGNHDQIRRFLAGN